MVSLLRRVNVRKYSPVLKIMKDFQWLMKMMVIDWTRKHVKIHNKLNQISSNQWITVSLRGESSLMVWATWITKLFWLLFLIQLGKNIVLLVFLWKSGRNKRILSRFKIRKFGPNMCRVEIKWRSIQRSFHKLRKGVSSFKKAWLNANAGYLMSSKDSVLYV